ncbi:hypothetical protein BMW23_0929 [Bodo saltans virus]|uniref:Uncharacterized protein n=1 Tax=Bodo saltans virus TaxID=2024608 RepID=A0A2H4UVR4_9VIRU|nr:hypothetical protein QJ851_gp0911 [Bodo saltans virus]ATZ80974.1 hypothetical protein BMW23_0929 [Bodo saltans virus]
MTSLQDIRIRIKDGSWVPASVTQTLDFEKAELNEINSSGIKKENSFCYYIINKQDKFPIANWSVVKIFNHDTNEWYTPTNYVIWAFYDYVYTTYSYSLNDKTKNKKTYISKNTPLTNEMTNPTIFPFVLEQNIVFELYSNTNMIYTQTESPIMISSHEMKKYFAHVSIEQNKKTEQKTEEKIVKKQPSTWFESAFGFIESSNYQNNVLNLFQTYTMDGNSKYFNKIKIGIFDLFRNSRCQNFRDAPSGKVTFENIISDIRDIHKDESLSKNATIQVASQLNCLEMLNPSITPKSGITIYEGDPTQGPSCAICTPAGLAYRNYCYNGGQTSANEQLNMAYELLEYLQTFDKTINWNVQNGYLMIDEPNLRKINKIMSIDQERRRLARFRIMCGSHTDLGVFIDNKLYNHTVNHVYCSGLPIAYNSINPELWKGLGELFLEAMYENTLHLAHLNNLKTGENRPCYLTSLGGGAFGMNTSQISRAIQRACQIAAKKGFVLNVKLVHKDNIDMIYKTISPNYPISSVIANSAWDDKSWLAKCS